MLLVLPNDDAVLTESACNGNGLLDGHHFNNCFIEAVNNILQHTAERNFFGQKGRGHSSLGGEKVKNQQRRHRRWLSISVFKVRFSVLA